MLVISEDNCTSLERVFQFGKTDIFTRASSVLTGLWIKERNNLDTPTFKKGIVYAGKKFRL